MKYNLFTLVFLLHNLPLWAQSEAIEDSSFPFSAYWPVLLLPIFGIIWYRWRKAKKPH